MMNVSVLNVLLPVIRKVDQNIEAMRLSLIVENCFHVPFIQLDHFVNGIKKFGSQRSAFVAKSTKSSNFL